MHHAARITTLPLPFKIVQLALTSDACLVADTRIRRFEVCVGWLAFPGFRAFPFPPSSTHSNMLLNPVQTDAVEEFLLEYDTGTFVHTVSGVPPFPQRGWTGKFVGQNSLRDCSEYSRATRTVVRAATLAVVVVAGLALV